MFLHQELLSSKPDQRNWKGIVIALCCIVAILCTVAFRWVDLTPLKWLCCLSNLFPSIFLFSKPLPRAKLNGPKLVRCWNPIALMWRCSINWKRWQWWYDERWIFFGKWVVSMLSFNWWSKGCTQSLRRSWKGPNTPQFLQLKVWNVFLLL